MRKRARVCAQTALLVVGASAATAQTPGGTDPTVDPRVTVSVGYELHVERLRYTFHNLSNFDTPFLVPHEFTQSYAAGNHWLVGWVRYRLASERLTTEVGITPDRLTRGSDFDTFDNPDGDTIVTGTDGEVQMRSLRFAQWSETSLFGLPWRVGYRYERDRTRFLPADRVVTHTRPPSETRTLTFDRETTISQVHEIPIEVSLGPAHLRGWSLRFGGNMSPIIWARLTTTLPDKYPGRDVVFDAKALGYGARVEIQSRTPRWPLTVSVHYGRTWRYTAARDFHRSVLQLAATVGVR